jgi:hypothetical protein
MTNDYGVEGRPFTCKNARFQTNILKGYPHKKHAPNTNGSVLEEALLELDDGRSLWLEHALDTQDNIEEYWLMWYEKNGVPTIRTSAIFGKEELEKMVGRLMRAGLEKLDTGISGDAALQ